MSIPRLLLGPKTVLYINGHPYAAVAGVKFNSETPKKPLYAVDSGDPYELAPTTTKVTGTMALYRTVGDGGIEGAGMTVDFAYLPRERYFSMSLIDRSTDTQVFRADRCSVISQSWDIPSRGIVMGSVTFEALTWNNEAVELT